MSSSAPQNLQQNIKKVLLEFYDAIYPYDSTQKFKKQVLRLFLNKVITLSTSQTQIQIKDQLYDETDCNSNSSSQKSRRPLDTLNPMTFTFYPTMVDFKQFFKKIFNLKISNKSERSYEFDDIEKAMLYSFCIQYKRRGEIIENLRPFWNESQLQRLQLYYLHKYKELKQSMVTSAYEIKSTYHRSEYNRIRQLYQALKNIMQDQQNQNNQFLNILIHQFNSEYLKVVAANLCSKSRNKLNKTKSVDIDEKSATDNSENSSQNQIQKSANGFGVQLKFEQLNHEVFYGRIDNRIEIWIKQYLGGQYQVKQVSFYSPNHCQQLISI